MFRRLWYCMVLLLLPICHGFINPSNVATVVHKARKTTSYLDVGSAVLQETEDEARYWLHRAQECAYSTGRFCSLEETQQCLDEIVDIESACVMGTMTSNDVCDIETFLPDVVSQLQDKLTTATGMTTATTDAAQRDATRESHRIGWAFGPYLVLGIVWLITSIVSDTSIVSSTPTVEEVLPHRFL